MSGFEQSSLPPKPAVENSGEKLRREREERWEKTREEVEKLGDALGKGLDEKIKEVVVACKVLGLNTDQSCEGHVDEPGQANPWVRFAAPGEPKYRFSGEKKIWMEMGKKHRLSPEKARRSYKPDAYWEGMKKAVKTPELPQYKMWEKETALLRTKLLGLLDEFYRERETPEDVRLRLEDGPGIVWLLNGTGEGHKENSELTQAERQVLTQKLVEYQREMLAFGEFLRQKFFQEGSTTSSPKEG